MQIASTKEEVEKISKKNEKMVEGKKKEKEDKQKKKEDKTVSEKEKKEEDKKKLIVPSAIIFKGRKPKLLDGVEQWREFLVVRFIKI